MTGRIDQASPSGNPPHLVSDGATVGLTEAGEDLPQRTRGTVFGEKAGLGPGAEEEPEVGGGIKSRYLFCRIGPQSKE
jgi:hypothetical protein